MFNTFVQTYGETPKKFAWAVGEESQEKGKQIDAEKNHIFYSGIHLLSTVKQSLR